MTGLIIDTTIALGLCFEDQIDATVLQAIETLRTVPCFVPSHWHIAVADELLAAERRRKITHADRERFLHLLASLQITRQLHCR